MSVAGENFQGSAPQQGTEGTPSQGQGSEQSFFQGGGQQQDNSLANPFLANVAPQDRPIVEKYIRDWDAGVTQRFQQLQNQYAPYQQLGDIEDLQNAAALYELLNENPQAVYEFLQQELGLAQQPQGFQQQPGQSPYQQPQQFQQPSFQQPGVPQGFQGQQPQFQTPQGGFQGLPPELAHQWQQQQQLVNTMAQGFVQFLEQQQAEKEDQALDQALNQMKQKYSQYGEFDEDYVLTKVMQGMDLEAAVQNFYQVAQRQVNGAMQNQANAPTVLGGGGGAPGGPPQKLSALSSKDVKGLVANLVEQASAQG